MTPLGHIQISSAGLTTLLLPLAAGTPAYSSGVGGWGSTSRRGRKALSEWQGTELAAQEFAIELGDRNDPAATVTTGDGKQITVQAAIDTLEAMASAAGSAHPPSVRISGAVRGTHLDWVIADDIPWGAWKRAADGTLHYQELSLRLAEFNPGQVVTTRATNPRGPAHYTIHVSKKNETPQSIARTFLGSVKRWREITRVDGKPVRSGTRKLTPGTRLKIP